MPRAHRIDIADGYYHIINRANARLPMFFIEDDYQMIEDLLDIAKDKFDMRIIAYCIMPNHFHLILYPRNDGDIQHFMQWLTLSHTQRWHSKNKTVGTGHLYQGRYKSFLIQDSSLLRVLRYVERNALRANMVISAELWKYSSLYKRINKIKKIIDNSFIVEERLSFNYLDYVNSPISEAELESLRKSVNRGRPFGEESWVLKTIKDYGIEMTNNNKGRPKKGT